MAVAPERPELSEHARSERVEQFILQIEEEDGGLFMRLKDLPTERRDALKRTMAENSVTMMEVFRTPSDSDLGGRLAQAQSQCDAKIRAVLGDADFERYSLYQSSRAYRATVGNLANAMRAKGVGVSLELEHAMLDAYTEAAIEAARPLPPGAAPAPDKGGALASKKVGALLDGAALDAFLEAQIQRE